MRGIIGWIFIMSAVVLLIGCTRTLYVPQIRTEKIIDTLVQVRSDSAVIKALLECDSMGRVVMRELDEYKGKEAAMDFTFKNGEVQVVTRWKTQYIDRLKEIHDTTTVVQLVDKIIEKRHIPAFYKFTLWWFIGSIILATVWFFGSSKFGLIKKLLK